MNTTNVITPVTEFTVVRDEWLHGEGDFESALRRERDGKKCCLGFFCLAGGFTAEEINGKPMPYVVAEDYGYHNAALLPLVNEEGDGGSTYIASEMAGINDDAEMDDADRERILTEKFASIGVKVNFV